MPFQPMGIHGAFVFTPVRHGDSRGHFQESFKLSSLDKELGLGFEVKQVNQSTSAKGVIRGIHFADTPPGQAKYVSCLKGAIWDVVVDLRTESPTFGKWEGVEVSADNGKAVLIAEGLGHGFLSLQEGSVVTYLCSEEYSPEIERFFLVAYHAPLNCHCGHNRCLDLSFCQFCHPRSKPEVAHSYL
jgi:dTDP-4-dehydrorhamnose 3,5-epimerase